MNIVQTVQHLIPTARTPEDFVVTDEGNGQTIEYWNDVTLGPQPSMVELQTTWDSVVSLNYAKKTKVEELRELCRSAIIVGFNSSAIGSARLYPNKNTPENPDQLNLASATLAAVINAANPGWTMPMWCYDQVTEQWMYESHTAAQIRQVATDGKAFVVLNQTRLNDLVTRVYASSTVDEINSINW